MTKEQAEKRREEVRKTHLAYFCPLIRDTCRADCICFRLGRIWKSEKEGYFVTGVGCSNDMFFTD